MPGEKEAVIAILRLVKAYLTVWFLMDKTKTHLMVTTASAGRFSRAWTITFGPGNLLARAVA
jgi:hypothetical protein